MHPSRENSKNHSPALQLCNFLTHNWGLRQSRKPHIQRTFPVHNAPHLFLTIITRTQRSICAHSEKFNLMFLLIFFLRRCYSQLQTPVATDNQSCNLGSGPGPLIHSVNTINSRHSSLKYNSFTACLHGQRVGKTPHHGHTQGRIASGCTAENPRHETWRCGGKADQ